MNSYFSSNIFRKTVAGISGLFLVIFLIGHLIGNLQLILLNDSIVQKQFNEYALFMTTNPAVKILSYLTYFSIIFHTLLTIGLTIQSKQSRPIPYAVSSGNKNSSWSSKNMAILGTLILIFLIIHLRSFWYHMHFGVIPVDTWGNKDLYSVTISAFEELWYTIFYVISMVALGIHIKHGIESSFQTLGIKNKKFTSLIHVTSLILSILLSSSFAIIPIIIYIKS